MFFSTSHVWMWELDYNESWVLKNWCFWTVVLEKTLESPLDCKEIQPVHPKGDQSWIFTGRTDTVTPILWPPDVKNWLIWKDSCWERLKAGGEGDNRGWDGGWHHWHNGHEFEQTRWDSKACMLYSMGLESRTQLRDWTAIGDITKRTLLHIILQKAKSTSFRQAATLIQKVSEVP